MGTTTPGGASRAHDPNSARVETSRHREETTRRHAPTRRRRTLSAFIAVFGRGLIAVGGIAVLFAGFEVWGTNILEARAQHALRRDFAAQVEAPRPPTAKESGSPRRASPRVAIPTPGEAVARIQIPSIGVDRIVIEGVGVGELRQGPGHYPGTAFPGGVGNVGIAGHRTTYGAPFSRLDELVTGSPIDLQTAEGLFHYRVTGIRVVPPGQVDVLAPTSAPTLTLTTCNPRFSSRERLVVTATLHGTPPAVVRDTRPAETSAGADVRAAPTRRTDDTSTSPGALVIAGFPATAVATAWWLVVRRWRNWPARVAGLLPFLVALVPFFVGLERALPANF